MDVFVRLHHKRELVSIRVPEGSCCGDILAKFNQNDSFYIQQNGRPKSLHDELRPNETVDLVGRLRGGKGGFGSMLRAIGAQIEKTTNREACRDLTGRRLRAINDERRIRHYARLKAQREQEREERRRRKLETLATSVPRHDFDDQEYLNERSQIPDRVEKALEDALSEEPSREKPKSEASTKIKGAWLDELDPEISEGSPTKSPSKESGYDREGTASSQQGPKKPNPCLTQTSTDGPSEPGSSKQEVIETVEEHPMDTVANQDEDDSKVTNSLPLTSNSPDQRPSTNIAAEAVQRSTEESKVGKSVESEATGPLDISSVSSADELVSKFSPDMLKAELSRRGVKCGGTPKERAERLWIVKDLGPDDIPKKLRAKK